MFLLFVFFTRKKILGEIISFLMILASSTLIFCLLYFNPGSEEAAFGKNAFFYSEWVYQKPWYNKFAFSYISSHIHGHSTSSFALIVNRTRVGPFVLGIYLGYVLFNRKKTTISKINPVNKNII